MDLNKIKNITICVLFVVALGEGIVLNLMTKQPKVAQSITVDTKAVDYWKAQYTTLQTTMKQTIAKNIESEKTVTKLYDENGKLKSEVTEYKKKDLSKIDTAQTSTSTTTVTVAGKIVEKQTDKLVYTHNTIYLGGNIYMGTPVYFGAEVSYSSQDIEANIGYIPYRKEFHAGFMKSIVGW